MKEKLIGLIKLILCIILITYGEKYYPDFLSWVGIDLNSFTSIIQEIFIIVLYLLIAYIIYLLYKEDFVSDFERFKRKWFPNTLMSIVYFGIFTIAIWVINYITEVTAKSFDIRYIGLNYYNLFDEKLNLELVFLIVKFVIIMPVITTSSYIFGLNEVVNSKKMLIFLTGVIGGVVACLNMNGSLTFMAFNLIPYFAIYFGLAYIYMKNNENIFFSITTYILYTSLACLLIERIS